jgi:hypothetical protein
LSCNLPIQRIPPADSAPQAYIISLRLSDLETQPLKNVVSNTNEIFSAEVPTIKMSSSAANMSERGDIWHSRSFQVTCILSGFIGAVTVGMLLGEPDVLMLFGAVGGVMVGAVFYAVVAGAIRLLF